MAAPPTDLIVELLACRDWPQLGELLAATPGPDLAELLVALPPVDWVVVFRLLEHARASELFAHLDPAHQAQLIAALTDDETRYLLRELAPDDRTQMLGELPGELVQELLNALEPEQLAEARTLLGYPEHSVGRLMTPRYVAVHRGWTIAQALAHIREWADDAETISVIMVIDDHWHLLDTLPLEYFVIAEPEQIVDHVMDHEYVAVSADAESREAVELIQRYDLLALPVVDSENVLVGIVTVDDILDVVEREATEDFHKAAAIAPLAASYRGARVGALVRRRVGWLVGLVFVNLLSSGVIAAFEDTLATTIALAFFLPLLIDSGGNTGAQSATMVVRALATGDLRSHDWTRTLAKELGVGVALGAAMGLASALLGIVRAGPAIGAVVGLSMAVIVILTNLVGATLPFLLTRVRVDPAAASSPLITTVADASGLLIYFSIASWILGSVA
jgi:magnesium transporter